MPDGLPAPLKLQIPTDLVFVRPVRKIVEGLLHAQGWEEDDVDDASLIITEIVQNAVEHGSKGDGTETVDITIHALAGALELEVVDPGTGESPQAAIDRDVVTPVPMDEPRGRGLFLIHKLAGRMQRCLASAGGLCVRVRKEVGA